MTPVSAVTFVCALAAFAAQVQQQQPPPTPPQTGAPPAGHVLGVDHVGQAPFLDHAGEELGIVGQVGLGRLEQGDAYGPMNT